MIKDSYYEYIYNVFNFIYRLIQCIWYCNNTGIIEQALWRTNCFRYLIPLTKFGRAVDSGNGIVDFFKGLFNFYMKLKFIKVKIKKWIKLVSLRDQFYDKSTIPVNFLLTHYRYCKFVFIIALYFIVSV